MEFSMTEQEIDDLLIQVIAMAGLTTFLCYEPWINDLVLMYMYIIYIRIDHSIIIALYIMKSE